MGETTTRLQQDMLRISKIVSGKFVETLQELLYTALANLFSNSAPPNPQHHLAGIVSELSQEQRERMTKVKAPVIFMVLLGLLSFDEASTQRYWRSELIWPRWVYTI